MSQKSATNVVSYDHSINQQISMPFGTWLLRSLSINDTEKFFNWRHLLFHCVYVDVEFCTWNMAWLHWKIDISAMFWCLNSLSWRHNEDARELPAIYDAWQHQRRLLHNGLSRCPATEAMLPFVEVLSTQTSKYTQNRPINSHHHQ